jgi:hypothetical protein
MVRPTSKKAKEPPKEVNHKGNIKFPNPLLLPEAFKIMKGQDLLKGGLALKNPRLLQTACLKIEIICAHYNITDTLCI